MAASVPTLDALEPPRWRLDELLRTELAPTPGRLNATLRIVTGVTIVLITSMALDVPLVGLSAFVVMFLTMVTPGITTQNSVFVAIATTLTVVILTLCLALTMLIYRFTIDYPPLRLGAMALALFLGMYASRTLASPVVGTLLALIVFVTQAFVDLFPSPEVLVRAILWVWVAIVYPAAVAVVVNFLLLPADPEPLLRREAAERIRAVARVITAVPGSNDARSAAASLARFTQQGSAPLLKLVALAEVRDRGVKPMRGERTAKIFLVERLVASAVLLPDLVPEASSSQRARLERVAAACERFAAAISSGAAALPVAPSTAADGDDPPSALRPVLSELERIVQELPLAERPEADHSARAERPLVADARTNPRYARFALKVMMAGMFCYITYTAVDYSGIHTCMITCVFVALGTAGATIRKSALRLTGCAIGSVIALASMVFLVPHMTSITELVLLVAAVTAPAAWIAMGSERTAYAGLQMAFAFYLAVLQQWAPTTELKEVRDRLIGIVFGVVVMGLMFSYVWPERAGTGMVEALLATLRRMGELAVGTSDPREVRAAAWGSLDQAERLAETFAFEREALTPSGAEQGRRVLRLVELTRRVLLVQAALHPETAPPAGIDSGIASARTALGSAIAQALAAVANRIETGTVSHPSDLRSPLAALHAAPRASESDAAAWLDSQLALSEALVERVEILAAFAIAERALSPDDPTLVLA